jgi:hypothetical protein
MAKRIVPDYYTFTPGTATITIPHRIIPRNQLLLVVNVSSNTVLYNFSDPDLTLASYVCPYDTTGTRFVLNFDTSAMSSSDSIMIMEDEEVTRIDFSEVAQDPTNKLRIAAPQSLIDTDFEYGLQPIKWESFGMVQNIQSFWFRGGGNGLDVSAISAAAIGSGTSSGRSIITVTTATPHNLSSGDVVSVSGTTNPLAEGTFFVTSIASTVQFTYAAKGSIGAGSIYTPYVGVQGGSRYDSNNLSSNIVLSSTVTALSSDNASTSTALSGSMVTVITGGRHGLLKGSPIMLMSSTTTSVNGSWSVYDVPTSNSFRFVTVGERLPAVVVSSTAAIYVNPEVNFIHRSSDGGVLINSNVVQEGISAIRQTRRYFRYQSGKGIQMSTGTKFTPTLDINSISSAGTSVTVSVQQPLTFATGVTITISDVETNDGMVNNYNGSYSVVSVDPQNRNFTYFTTSNTDLAPGGQGFATIKNFKGSVVRCGMFDFQNGFYFEYDGTTLFAVRRDSVKEGMGTLNVTNGSSSLVGVGTKFSKQLVPGDYMVIRGQSYLITSVDADNNLSISPKYRGTTLSGVRFNITRNTRFPQSTWNLDRCDGAGPSGFLLDIAKMQMCYIDYTWYGAGTIRFGFRDANGNVIYCHRIANNNRNFAAYMRSGNLPARYEVTNIGPYGPLISGDVNTRGVSLSSAAGSLVVENGEYWPNSGLAAIQQGDNVEYFTYGAKAVNTAIGGYTLSGLDRRVTPGGSTSNLTFTIPEYYGGTSGNSSVAYVTFVGADVAPVISHWGTSVIMDGGFDEDRSIVFSYGKRTSQNIAAGTSIAIVSIRLAPAVDNSIVGALGQREIVNRMQLKLSSIDTNARGPLLIQGFLNPKNFTGAGAPALPGTWSFTSVVTAIGSGSLAQVIDHTSNNTTIQQGEQIFAFFADSGVNSYNLGDVRDLGNCAIGGDGSNIAPGFPNGPDVLTIVATNVSSGAVTLQGVRISWTEAQA